MIDVPVEVKDALREGTYKKNYSFVVLNEDGTESEIGTIDNDNLVSESVSIDERMCSGDTLKFGLCEGSSLEFQYFGKPNITGKRVQAFVDVDYEMLSGVWEQVHLFVVPPSQEAIYTITEAGTYRVNSNSWYMLHWRHDGQSHTVEMHDQQYQTLGELVRGDMISVRARDEQAFISLEKIVTIGTYTIPMGFFDVKKCSRQASTGIIKATCYNKLQSEYLDAKANELLLSSVDDPQTDITIYSIKKVLLEHFQIDPYEQTEKQRDNTLPIFMNTITKSVKLSDLTSDGGPINYFSLLPGATAQGKTLNTNTVLSLQIRSAGIRWSISESDVNYYQVLQSIHDFSSLSESFVDYVISLLNSCPLTKTGDTIISEIKNINEGDSHGWGHLFGFNYYTSSEGMKYYNDYAYKNQNDGTYRVNGTSRDFMLQLYGKKNITIYAYVPFLIDVNIRANNMDYGLYSVQLFGDTPISYSGSGGSTKYYPQFTYEDGTFITQPTTPDFVVPFEDWLGLYEINGISQADLTKIIPESSPEFTLREITTASYETVCQFGQLSRVTDLFSGVELNHSRLYPSDTLYPSDSLYPSGAAANGFRSMYSKLWADEGNVHKWRYLIITYKGLNGDDQEEDFTLQRTVNTDGTDDYNMSDNWLFRNLVWTAEQVGDYADAMVAKMQDVTWFPFEMWCAGLPYIETGDEIEIPLGEHSYTSYVLQRQLKGIQNLQDTYINGTLDIF